MLDFAGQAKPISTGAVWMTPEERNAAWQRCEELRRQLEALFTKGGQDASLGEQKSALSAELDQLEDFLSVDLIQQESAAQR